MDSERWHSLDRLLEEVLSRNPDERNSILDERCGSDKELRSRIDALLAAHDAAGGFMEDPPTDAAFALLESTSRSAFIPRVIASYEILSRIGSGGMGEVYLAKDTRLERRVAIKLLQSHLAGDPNVRQRFLREAQLASSLDHPNICTIHEVGEDNGNCFIAMQYVEGETLKAHINGGQLPVASVLSIAQQIADAIASAHERGIVHRDIKSSNIIINQRGQVKILDFGLAKLIEESDTTRNGNELTGAGTMMGTPGYMSPEQARGELADFRSDIFSFGIVLYEMVSGRLPFNNKSAAETMSSIINDPHPRLTRMNLEVPEEFESVIDRCLAKNPADRYQSAAEILDLLEQMNSKTKTLVREGSEAPQYPNPFSRMMRRSGTIVIAIIIVLGLIPIYFLIRARSTASPGQRIESIAVLPFKPLEATSRDELLEIGVADTLITGLSNIRQINVRSIKSVRNFANSDVDPIEAGRQLQVDAVLDGHIQKAGDRVRATVRFTRISDGKILWADRFDETYTNIFAVQDSISERVVASLAPALGTEERALLKKRYTNNIEAWQLYLTGRYFWNKRTREGYDKAIEYFSKAIVVDKNYALAYAGLADTYHLLGDYTYLPPQVAFPKARDAALKAIEIDDQLAEAHTSLAYALFLYDWDYKQAEAEFRKALDLNPGYATANQWYAEYKVAMGEMDQAVQLIEQACERDPTSLVLNSVAGWVFYMSRDYDQAISRCRKATEMDQTFYPAHFWMGQAYEKKRMFSEAISEYEKAVMHSQRAPETLASLGHAYAASGDKTKAMKILTELTSLSKREYVSPYFIALVYSGLGDTKNMSFWLDKAVETRARAVPFFGVDPMLDGQGGRSQGTRDRIQ